MDLKYRKATREDAPLITQLADTIWKQHYISIITLAQIEYMLSKMYSTESLLKQMETGHQFTIVSDGSTPVGYISLSTLDQKKYFLHKFYIGINEQRKGVGSTLFKYILNELPMAKTIELTVNRKNYKAINFYFKNGFVIKDIADFDIGENYFMNDFVMVRTSDEMLS